MPYRHIFSSPWRSYASVQGHDFCRRIFDSQKCRVYLFTLYALRLCSNWPINLVALPNWMWYNSISFSCFSCSNANSCSFLISCIKCIYLQLRTARNIAYFWLINSICLMARSAMVRSDCLNSFRIVSSVWSSCFWNSLSFSLTFSSNCDW